VLAVCTACVSSRGPSPRPILEMLMVSIDISKVNFR
jgi:hypothetical protein